MIALARALIAVLLFVSGSNQTHSASITFEFSATIDGINNHNSAPSTDGSILLGAQITGRYSFESLTPALPNSFGLVYTGGSFTARIGNYTLTAPLQIEIWNNALGSDKYEVIASGPAQLTNGTQTFAAGSPMGNVIVWWMPMYDFDMTALASEALRLVPPAVGDFETRFSSELPLAEIVTTTALFRRELTRWKDATKRVSSSSRRSGKTASSQETVRSNRGRHGGCSRQRDKRRGPNYRTNASKCLADYNLCKQSDPTPKACIWVFIVCLASSGGA